MLRCSPAGVLLSVLAAPALSQSPGTEALSFSGFAGIASGLVYRGVDLADESVVPHLDIALAHRTGFYLHGWLSRVSLPPPTALEGQDSNWQGLIDAGYSWRPSPDWTLSISHSWYRYDRNAQQLSPNYREWAVSVDYSALLVLEYAHSEDLWGLETEQDMLSVSGRWSVTRHVLGAATLGRVEQDGYYQADYTFTRLNLGLLMQDWSFQLQYHESFDVEGLYLDDRLGSKWVAQLNWHW